MNTWDDNQYLVHYGVKNMKWGVRRYQNEDGTLTQLGKEHYGVGSGGNSKFEKKYEHEQNKLQKLEDRADITKQTAKAITYDQRAKALKKVGRGALAVAVPAGVATGMSTKDFHQKAVQDLVDINNRANEKMDALKRTSNLGSTPTELKGPLKDASNIYRGIRNASFDAYVNLPSTYNHNLYAAIAGVAGVTAVASYGASAYNRIQSSISKRRITEKGHAKAVDRLNKQYNKISNMVKGTKLETLFHDQIEAYKKEHPNSELSDKQIMNNLM